MPCPIVAPVPLRASPCHFSAPARLSGSADDPGFAYVSVRGRDILEYAGDVAAGDRILRFLLASGDWNVAIPPAAGTGPWEELLLGYARSFSVAPAGMGCVIRLDVLLQAYLPLLERRLRDWRGSFVLACTDGEAVCLSGTTAGVQVSAATSAADLVLSRNDLALLLFGPFQPALGELADHPFLRLAFPLPLHWQPLAHV